MNLKIENPTNIETGLLDNEVVKNKRNKQSQIPTLTYKQIVKENVLTLFNGINLFLFILVCFTRSYHNGLFMGVVFINLAIGMIQSFRAKRVLDQLTLLNQKKAKVLRNGKEIEVPIEKVVENDIVFFGLGDQISFDCVVVEGVVECNESNLTGESVSVKKEIGDTLYSASYVVAGFVKAQVVHVQEDTYAYSIIKEVKKVKRYPSDLRDGLNKIIKVCTLLLIPLGILLFIKLFHTIPLQKAVLNTVAAVIGMIPSGLVLLTSVALAVGAIRLSKQLVLIKELYCQETLARVDTLCLDKTGTITEGAMKVVKVEAVDGFDLNEIQDVLKRMYGSINATNATAQAIKEYVPESKSIYKKYIPFSSVRKGMGFEFEDGCFICGSYTNLFSNTDAAILKKIEEYTNVGMRVVVVAKTDSLKEDLSGCHQLMGLVCIQDQLKKDIKEILNYFKAQGVDIKIISGDDAHTIQYVIQQAGLNYEVVNIEDSSNISTLVENNQAFGRVKPEQKKEIIQALKQQGKVVAMVGDGVNDMLALKEADCSITFKNGSEACQNICSIVLLDNQFEKLPLILKQGRNVINNIERSASLFLVKTLYSICLTILTLFVLQRYPFVPIQLTLISSLMVGFPGFVLSFEPNDEKVSGNFIKKVFSKAIPTALCISLTIVVLEISSHYLEINQEQLSTMALLLTAWNSYCFLLFLCRPLSKIRILLLIGVALAFLLEICFLPSLFSVVALTWKQYVYLVVNMMVVLGILFVLYKRKWR